MALNLTPYEPVNLVNDLNSIIDNIWNRSGNLDDTKVATSRWLPAIDIREDKDQFVLFADLPGMDPKDIEISMEKNVLTIKGKREDIKKEEKISYYRVERNRGEFYRRFTLPDTADGERINAKSKQGVLEIIIPKKEIAQARKIKIDIER